MLSLHLFSSGNLIPLISSPLDILVCTRCIFLRSPKKRRKDGNGIRWMRIQICWSLDFFLFNWSSVIDEGVITTYAFILNGCLHQQNSLGWTNTCQNGSVWVWASVGRYVTCSLGVKIINYTTVDSQNGPCSKYFSPPYLGWKICTQHDTGLSTRVDI